jgi:hypothetical protein
VVRRALTEVAPAAHVLIPSALRVPPQRPGGKAGVLDAEPLGGRGGI